MARLRALQQEIESLLASLSPEDRDQARRLLAEERAEESAPATDSASPDVEGGESRPAAASQQPRSAGSSVASERLVLSDPTEPLEPTEPREPAENAQPSAPWEPSRAALASAGDRESDPTAATARACRGLRLLDHDGDGALTGADRYWRHLYLDLGSDRAMTEEPISVFEAGVRRIALDLRSFVDDSDRVGYLEFGERVRLDVVVRRRRGVESGVLIVDADDLARFGGPRIQNAEGELLGGWQPLRRGLVFVVGDRQEAFECP